MRVMVMKMAMVPRVSVQLLISYRWDIIRDAMALKIKIANPAATMSFHAGFVPGTNKIPSASKFRFDLSKIY